MTRPAAALETFLAAGGTTLPEVVAGVGTAVGLGGGDRLLAAGSVVEGLGSRKSDLDLILLAADPDRPGAPEQVALVIGRCVVEVRIVRAVALRTLRDRFDAWCRSPWDVSREAGFGADERRLLHRLRHSLVLHRGERDGFGEVAPAAADLARLKLHDARQTARTVQVDLVGYREAGDHRSLLFAAQDLLGRAVDALTASYGLTNPVPKWRSRLLDRVPAGWERAFAVRPSALPAGERLWRLHRAPESADRIGAGRHALAATAFARSVFAGAERRLLTGCTEAPLAWPAGGAVPAAARGAGGARGDGGPGREPLPPLDFDVDFAPTGGPADPVLLARLNEAGRPVPLPPRHFAAVLLFDGVTTAAEAQAALPGGTGEEVRQTLAAVRAAHLIGPGAG
jgi:hypothetical protein